MKNTAINRNLCAIIYALQSFELDQFESIKFENETDFILTYDTISGIVIKYVCFLATNGFDTLGLLAKFNYINNYIKKNDVDEYSLVFITKSTSKELDEIMSFVRNGGAGKYPVCPFFLSDGLL